MPQRRSEFIEDEDEDFQSDGELPEDDDDEEDEDDDDEEEGDF